MMVAMSEVQQTTANVDTTNDKNHTVASDKKLRKPNSIEKSKKLSECLLTRLNKLWEEKILPPGREWFRYGQWLATRHPLAAIETPEVHSNIAYRFSTIEGFADFLQLRLNVLAKYRVTQDDAFDPIGTTTQLLAQNMPTHIVGTETATSILKHGLDTTLSYLWDRFCDIEEAEGNVMFCFESLGRNYNAAVEILRHGNQDLDAAEEVVKKQKEAMLEEDDGGNQASLTNIDDHYG
jgi:hypothetical protein